MIIHRGIGDLGIIEIRLAMGRIITIGIWIIIRGLVSIGIRVIIELIVIDRYLTTRWYPGFPRLLN